MPASIRSLGRLFELFAPAHPELRVTEVAAELGISKASAHELLRDLSEAGLLHRTTERRYRLGWQILALSKVLLDSTSWRDEARRGMEAIVSRFGETTHLAGLERGNVVYLEKLEGTRSVQVRATAVGVQLPAHGSAVGKILLAHCPHDEVERMIAEHGLPALTSNTVTSPSRLFEELEIVRRKGHAFDLEETLPDICCVAAPIRNHSGEVVAAMSVSVPAYRFQRHESAYREALVGAAHQVSHRLGYRPRPEKRRPPT